MSEGLLTAAIVVAGGSGERFGRSGGKQLVQAAGRPVLSWTLEAIASAPEIDLLVVVRPQEQAEEFEREVLSRLGAAKPVRLAASGSTRQQSVLAGLHQLPTETQTVLVHDGARPLLTAELVSSCIARLRQSGAQGVVVGHPSVDTLKVVKGDEIVETPERSRFWQVQTPQVFDREVLVSAHLSALESGFVGTDDASLVERAGGRTVVVEGPRDNIKVTRPEDLAFVEAVLRERRKGES